MDFFRGLVNSAGRGVNSAVGGTISDPSVSTFGTLGRSMLTEALPGNQITSLDKPIGNVIAAGDELNRGGTAVNAGVRNQTGSLVGRARENIAETAGSRGARMAGTALARRLPGIGARIAAGTSASAGVLGPVMGVVGAAEIADAVIETATGKGVVGWANDPAKIRGRSGAKRAGVN
jgi:hypothetical protein